MLAIPRALVRVVAGLSVMIGVIALIALSLTLADASHQPSPAELAMSSAFAPSGTTFNVNSPADVPDANPGDGVCETSPGNGVCTLRAAIQEANHHAGGDIIKLQANTTYLLTRAGSDDTALNGDLDITDTVSILGAGANSTVIDGNGGVTNDRVFQITGTVTISGVTIEHGYSGNEAGGIYNTGNLTIMNSAIISNTANGLNDWGGGIYNAGPLTLTNSIISGNQTGPHNSYGGGIYNQAPMTILNSTISGNTTVGSLGEGGGIFHVGMTATIRSSTISGNTATQGGGIYHTGYPLYVIDSTISGNDSTGSGGGIYNHYGTTSLYNATITQNRANSDDSGSEVGGGVVNESGTLTFLNSIIAMNEVIIPTSPFPTLGLDDCYGTVTSQGNSILYWHDAGYCTINGSYSTADPQLGALANNGGLTQTHALSAGSPAIDAVIAGGCTDNLGASLTTDQRGYPRVVDGDHNGSSICDMGAYEYGSAPPTPTPRPTNTPTITPTRTTTPTLTPTATPCASKPTAPTLLKPNDKQELGKTRAALDWSDVVCATQYQVSVQTGAQKGPKADRKTVTASQYKTIALAKGVTYFWRVKACNAVGCTKSRWLQFTVKP